eukprot:TRINITY_DN59442_c0_g1_i1.p1 TRINITY_DN59442_c0_g1~~TRINITY_DN59442_c0_g1_i1.p1  ORF type:complete len:155 (+),score=21.08 TRINITY_DN59442_c0_g1_i1:51-515(+)
MICVSRSASQSQKFIISFFFFNDTATTEIYTRSIVGSVRCVQETGYQRRVHGGVQLYEAGFVCIFSTFLLYSLIRFFGRGFRVLDVLLNNMYLIYFQRLYFIPSILLLVIFDFLELTFILLMDQTSLYLTIYTCLLYTSPSPRDLSTSRMPSSA